MKTTSWICMTYVVNIPHRLNSNVSGGLPDLYIQDMRTKFPLYMRAATNYYFPLLNYLLIRFLMNRFDYKKMAENSEIKTPRV